LSASDGRRQVTIEGVIPGASAGDANLLRNRITTLVNTLVVSNDRSGRSLEPFDLLVRYGAPALRPPATRPPPGAEPPADQGPQFVAIDPSYRLDQVVLPGPTREALLDCISFVEVTPLVFGTWGLSAIEPHPSIAVNFRGPPGTGKTMAAHAAASHLGRKILLSRVSDLESKYHGEGPKNLAGLFESARAQDAVVFIDEAESLLSRRFAQPEQAAESAINSMRTELLMALDAFDGLVILASNLPDSYDIAIESRLLHVDFTPPDRATRRDIWRLHLPSTLPLDPDCSVDRLADVDGVTGRDIKLAVIRAAVGTARRGEGVITEGMLTQALLSQRDARRPIPALDQPEVARALSTRLDGLASPAAAPEGP
jgi:SpoVK/Ycf46/Vps4 family AAA+-type ATPase